MVNYTVVLKALEAGSHRPLGLCGCPARYLHFLELSNLIILQLLADHTRLFPSIQGTWKAQEYFSQCHAFPAPSLSLDASWLDFQHGFSEFSHI